MHFLTVLGARPQFVKAAPLSAALRSCGTETIVHTGQHYDAGMSEVFFAELGIAAPDYCLGVGSGAHGAQTGAMLTALEQVMVDERPDVVVVLGDTNSTLAGALAAAKLHIPVAHVEAGLRSFNRSMPEEINRVMTDHLSDWSFAPSDVARRQLANEGITRGVHVVGDIMLDAVMQQRERAATVSTMPSSLKLDAGAYLLATIHRAENTNDRDRLTAVIDALGALDMPVVMPVHPRTRDKLAQFGLSMPSRIHVIEPVGYLDMLALLGSAACVVTDSGGVQKEAYYVSVPCVTLREETEWVETVTAGWNVLCPANAQSLKSAVALMTTPRPAQQPLYGDGSTARQIAAILSRELTKADIMCGISGVISIDGAVVPALAERLQHMNSIQAHRGPDGEGCWMHPFGMVGLAHRRLSIIDIATGAQPMRDAASGCVITYNGELYNYRELRDEIGAEHFRTASDTEVILRAWLRWGPACVERLRGMFAFSIWDPREDLLFCARDRFGVKPFFYTEANGHFHFASEAKALLSFLPSVETDVNGLRDYLAFQLCLAGKTMFEGVRELQPGHSITVSRGRVTVSRYWEVFFELDFSHRAHWFEERTRELLDESVALHLRSDVPVGAYVSGGIDSGIVATLASQHDSSLIGFTGTFPMGPEYDETRYARDVALHAGIPLHERAITVDDFIRDIGRVMYHLDYPIAGPGSFSQFEVSALAAQHRKVVLGGQGGDEIFGGYTRYLIAYFEQCIKAAIEGTAQSGNFVVTYESIIPNLSALRNYKPLLQEFWRDGLFAPMNERYFRLINRAPHLGDTIRWSEIGTYSPFETFVDIFDGRNLKRDSYFDRMTHFDFKTLLPALLHVEDRVSMAHGLEARVPMLDHPLVEFAATIPADVKFTNGELKRSLLQVARGILPQNVTDRKDKMGFPTPFTEWARGPARDFVFDLLSTRRAQSRRYVDNKRVLELVERESRFGRNLWALFSLELWHQTFHDVVTPFNPAAVVDSVPVPLVAAA